MRLLKDRFDPRRMLSGVSGFGPGESLKPIRPSVFHPSSLIPNPSPARSRAGVTLVELMIAMAIVTIGVVGTMGSFKYINEALEQSRIKSIATNIAQEKMEVLKNKSYFQLMVTTAPALSSGFNPNFTYDPNNYPPEVFTLWGLPALTRSVNIDYVSVSGASVSTIPYSNDDPGMKKITVYVSWTKKGTAKKVQLDSYYQNPGAATLSAGFNGRITESGSPAMGVLVQVAGVPKWRSYSNSNGDYSFQVVPGSYTLVCSSAGFFSQSTSTDLYVSQGNYTSYDFSIIRIASGTVGSDSVYAINPSLVISQVVASTVQADGFDVQYIELFNPTTAAIAIADSAGVMSAHSINLNILSTCGTQRRCEDVRLNYVNTTVDPGVYYLIANRASFMVLGTNYTADAYYNDSAGAGCAISPPAADWLPPSPKRLIQPVHNGVVWLTDSGGNTLDTVGWKHAGTNPTTCETNCVPLGGGGLLNGDQLVRFSTPCAAGITYGRAYDTGDNANSFYYNHTAAPVGISYKPFNTASPQQISLSGVPALRAYVFADDGNSAAVQSSSSPVTGLPNQTCWYSSFTIVGVATGTWKVTAIYENYISSISNVMVSQGATTSIPNDVTESSWPVSGLNYMILPSTYTGGLAAGYVYGDGPDYWLRLNGKMVGSSDGNSIPTDSQGWYFLPVSTGTAVITANYNSADGNYTTSNAIADIEQGSVTYVADFHLAKGGYLKGYVTSGTGALPNIPVRATLGGAVYEDTTDSTGYFYIFAATAAAAYTVAPELDPLQSFTSLPTTPLLSSVTVPGATVFAGTITVIGALGTISGSVTAGGSPITTGVLVVASTVAVPSPLSAIYASLAPSQAVFYSISSKSDGTYSLEVRSSTTSTYNIRAFYPVVDLNTGSVSYTSTTTAAVSVGAGAEVTGRNFSWP